MRRECVTERGIELGRHSGAILMSFPWQCGYAGIALRGRDLSSPAGSVVLLCAGLGSRPEWVTPFFSSWIGFHLHQFSELVYCMDKKHL